MNHGRLRFLSGVMGIGTASGASGGSPYHIATCCMPISTILHGLKSIYLVSQISLDLLPPTQEVNVLPVFVCLSVSKITQKRVHGFG